MSYYTREKYLFEKYQAFRDLSQLTYSASDAGKVLTVNSSGELVLGISSGGNIISGSLSFDINNAQDNEVLKYDSISDTWVNGFVDYSEIVNKPILATVATSGSYNDLLDLPSIPSSANDLVDITITSPVSGQVLKFDGANWINATVEYTEISNTPTALSAFTNDLGYITGVSSLNDIGDVNTGTLDVSKDGYVLYWNNTNSQFELKAITSSGGGATTLDELSDVSITSPGLGQVLQFNGTNWINDNISWVEIENRPTSLGYFTNDVGYITGISNLNEIGDVNTGPLDASKDGYVLYWNNTNNQFELKAITSSGSGATSLNELTDVTLSSPTLNNVLKFNGTEWSEGSVYYTEVINHPTSLSEFTNDVGYITNVSNINDIGNVNTGTLDSTKDGQVLYWNNSTGTFELRTESLYALDDLTNVVITSPINYEVLKFDGTNWINQRISYFEILNTPSSLSAFSNDVGYIKLDDLTSINLIGDVSITSATTNQILKFDGTNWVNSNVDYSEITNTPTSLSAFSNDVGYITGVNSLNEIGDVNTGTLDSTKDGYVLYWNNTNAQFELRAETVHSLNDLTDVNTGVLDSTQDGYVLYWNNTNSQFELKAISSGITTLNELTDVVLNSPASSEVLKFDGTAWTNQTIDYTEIANTPTALSAFTNDVGYITGVSSLNDIGDVTTGTLDSTKDGYVLYWNNTNAQFELRAETLYALDDLTDVTITNVTANEVLKHDGINWINSSVDYSEITNTPTALSAFTNDVGYITGIAHLDDIGDVNVGTPGSQHHGFVLYWNNVTSSFELRAESFSPSVLDDLADVNTTTNAPTNGDVLTYNGTEWVPGSSGASKYEWVEFLYSAGSSGNFNTGDNLVQSTSGVTATIIDGANCWVEFTFTGKIYPPTNIITYAQAYSTNEFIINSVNANISTRKVAGGGSSASPTLFSGNFTHTVTLSLTMSDTNASAGFGQRARLYVMFMFGV